MQHPMLSLHSLPWAMQLKLHRQHLQHMSSQWRVVCCQRLLHPHP